MSEINTTIPGVYQQHDWASGEVITEERMDQIEQGIYNNSAEIYNAANFNGTPLQGNTNKTLYNTLKTLQTKVQNANDLETAFLDTVALQSAANRTSIKGWKQGRLTTSGVTSSTKQAYSEELPIKDQKIYFETDDYEVAFGYYNESVAEPSTAGLAGTSSWFTTSPTPSPYRSGASYFRVMIKGKNNTDIVPDNIDNIYIMDKDKNLLVSTVNNLNDLVGGYGEIELPAPKDETYYTISSNEISEVTSSGSKAYEINLNSYIGNIVKVKFTTTTNAVNSNRITALCNNSDQVLIKYYEKEFVTTYAEDGVDFMPTDDYHKLYISFGPYASGLTVSNLYGMYGDIKEIKNNLPPPVAYVDGSVTTTGNGGMGNPFKTIQEGVNSGAEVVKVRAIDGNNTEITYASFSVTNRMTPLNIQLWEMPAYDVKHPLDNTPYITIRDTSANHGATFSNCAYISVSDMAVIGSPRYCFNFQNVQKLEVTRCKAGKNTFINEDGVTFSVFYFNNVNGVIRDCEAYQSKLDGFNIHGYGDTQFINCVAHDCDDDGISHHDRTNGAVIGGEYKGNGKAGIASPTYGAVIDVIGAYSHNNAKYGLLAASDDKHEPSKGRVNNCVFKDNTIADVMVDYCDVTAWGLTYGTKQVTVNGTLNELDKPTELDG